MSHEHETPEDWTDRQREVFSRVYRDMVTNQNLFTHPRAARVDDEHWTTTAWNAAWVAAHCAEPDAPLLVSLNEDGEVIGSEVPLGAFQ